MSDTVMNLLDDNIAGRAMSPLQAQKVKDELARLREEKQGWVNQATIEERERLEAEAQRDTLLAALRALRDTFFTPDWYDGKWYQRPSSFKAMNEGDPPTPRQVLDQARAAISEVEGEK